MADRLRGRVALVTGAAQGIGAAIARRFVAEGAHVVGIDRSAETLAQLVAERAAPPQGERAASSQGEEPPALPSRPEQPALQPFVADVTDHAALERCVGETIARWGRIDIVVNNAGFQYTVAFLDSTLEQWRQTQRVNVEAQYVLCKLVVPFMIEAGYGRIVNIASTQAIAVQPMVSAYAVSKGGVGAFTRSLAVDLAPHGILVNAIAPGWIRTPMNVIDGVDQSETEVFREWYAGRGKIPLARPGEAHEIAAAALFLASEECGYVTGHTLVADGGLTITF